MLSVGQSSTLNAELQVGNVSQVVEVTGSAPVLNTGNADVGSEVSSKQAVELPLNIRNVYGLVELDSSVNNSQQNQALNPPGRRATSIKTSPFSTSAADALAPLDFCWTVLGMARAIGMG